jgi:hypothetical protein
MHTPKRTALFLSLACLVLPLCLLAEERREHGSASVTFSADAYLDHVRLLASDEWGGRGPGQPGIEEAAEYVAEQFRLAGLLPAGEEGTYFQSLEIKRGKELLEEQAELRVKGLEAGWKVRTDWIPLPFGKPGEVRGPLAFAGYGLDVPKHNYSDYAEFDPNGKVLLVLRYEPRSDDPNAEFGGESPSSNAMFFRKAKWAAERGARALIIVNPPNRDPDKDELYDFDQGLSRQTYELPMIQVTRAVADQILNHAGLPDLGTLTEQIDSDFKPRSMDAGGVVVSLNTGTRAKSITARNVLGMLPGDGSTDEVVVVGAHYDHLGTSRKSDGTVEIYNGADDNASGTAGILELARAFSHQPRTRRGILFIAFTAEEMGLLGSRHFVDNPTIDFARIRFMMNLDMIGRYDPAKFQVHGVESSPDFKPLLEQLAPELGMKYRTARDMFGRSDHASFQRKGVPVLFPFTGLHAQYHQPSDDWELINAEGATRVLDLTYRLVHAVAEMESGPAPPAAEEEAGQPESQPAENGDAQPGEPVKPEAAATQPAESRPAERPARRDDAPPPMPRVRMGIMPDYTEGDRPGVRVEGVVEGGAAKAAGIQQGDLIVRIGESQISDIASYMAALGGCKPGDEVDVIVERGGETKTIRVKLGAQRQQPKDQ